MVEGPTGLPANAKVSLRPVWEHSLRRRRLPRGAQGTLFSTAEFKGVRVPELSHVRGAGPEKITHSEALVLIDALLPGAVEVKANDLSVLAPLAGQAWIIGSMPRRPGHEMLQKLRSSMKGAGVPARHVAGMRLLDRAVNVVRRHDAMAWVACAAVSDPSGCGTVDAKAHAAFCMAFTAQACWPLHD